MFIATDTLREKSLPTPAAVPTNKMLNPYRKTSSSFRGGSCDNQDGSNNDTITDVVANPSSGMGLQSQRRGGSVKKCLKRGSHAKFKLPRTTRLVQMGVDGGRAFEPNRDCVNCKSRYLRKTHHNVAISHKAHDIRCGSNRTTHGSSARTVAVNRYAKEMTARNNLPLSQGHTEGLPSVIQHFEKTTTTITTKSAGTTTTTTTNDVYFASDKEEQGN
jgi:hypothetical protein